MREGAYYRKSKLFLETDVLVVRMWLGSRSYLNDFASVPCLPIDICLWRLCYEIPSYRLATGHRNPVKLQPPQYETERSV